MSKSTYFPISSSVRKALGLFLGYWRIQSICCCWDMGENPHLLMLRLGYGESPGCLLSLLRYWGQPRLSSTIIKIWGKSKGSSALAVFIIHIFSHVCIMPGECWADLIVNNKTAPHPVIFTYLYIF